MSSQIEKKKIKNLTKSQKDDICYIIQDVWPGCTEYFGRHNSSFVECSADRMVDQAGYFLGFLDKENKTLGDLIDVLRRINCENHVTDIQLLMNNFSNKSCASISDDQITEFTKLTHDNWFEVANYCGFKKRKDFTDAPEQEGDFDACYKFIEKLREVKFSLIGFKVGLRKAGFFDISNNLNDLFI